MNPRAVAALVAGVLIMSAVECGELWYETVWDQRQAAPGPQPENLPGIENAFRLSRRLYSGGEPRGEADMAALKRKGIRTIISVDGSTPDVEAARQAGIRYVHLPIGYDGVPRDQAIRIVRAVETLPGPVYIHCHHGKHRGPAAAAVCARATEGWTAEQAVDWMNQAGASPDYHGLFESARAFTPLTDDERKRAGDEFPERSPVPDLVDLMVRLDGRWDGLKAARKAGFPTAPTVAKDDSSHDAIQVVEFFREASRLPEARDRGDDFLQALAEAERKADVLHGVLKARDPSTREKVDAAFIAVEKTCTTCHARNRDN